MFFQRGQGDDAEPEGGSNIGLSMEDCAHRIGIVADEDELGLVGSGKRGGLGAGKLRFDEMASDELHLLLDVFSEAAFRGQRVVADADAGWDRARVHLNLADTEFCDIDPAWGHAGDTPPPDGGELSGDAGLCDGLGQTSSRIVEVLSTRLLCCCGLFGTPDETVFAGIMVAR